MDANVIKADLLQACAHGDAGALRRLYELTSGQLFGIALRLVRRRELAEEILQETFVTVWRQAGAFDPGRGSAGAWLVAVLRNQCFDLLRRRAREEEIDDDSLAEISDPGPDPFDQAAHTESGRAIRHCLEQLEPDPRRCIMLAYFDGLSYEQVADQVSAPLGTVKSWIRRSLLRLKRCLGQ